MSSSELAKIAILTPHGRPAPAVIVLEGMPGAGKTTVANALAREGRTVIGEYLDPAGATIPVAEHPRVDDDAAHQANWLTKHRHIADAAQRGPVFSDRDWISALAYAYSAPGFSADLLAAQAHWAADHLARDQLALADLYVVFHLNTRTSLLRRAGRLTPTHPWSNPHGLARLCCFYRDPPAALDRVHPQLAIRMRHTTWWHIGGLSIEQTLRLLHDLANRR